jgi:hypothetical protein
MSLGRKFSKGEWVNYCKQNLGLSCAYSKFREKTFGKLMDFSIKAAIACGFTDVNRDTRSIRRLSVRSRYF